MGVSPLGLFCVGPRFGFLPGLPSLSSPIHLPFGSPFVSPSNAVEVMGDLISILAGEETTGNERPADECVPGPRTSPCAFAPFERCLRFRVGIVSDKMNICLVDATHCRSHNIEVVCFGGCLSMYAATLSLPIYTQYQQRTCPWGILCCSELICRGAEVLF